MSKLVGRSKVRYQERPELTHSILIEEMLYLLLLLLSLVSAQLNTDKEATETGCSTL